MWWFLPYYPAVQINVKLISFWHFLLIHDFKNTVNCERQSDLALIRRLFCRLHTEVELSSVIKWQRIYVCIECGFNFGWQLFMSLLLIMKSLWYLQLLFTVCKAVWNETFVVSLIYLLRSTMTVNGFWPSFIPSGFFRPCHSDLHAFPVQISFPALHSLFSYFFIPCSCTKRINERNICKNV